MFNTNANFFLDSIHMFIPMTNTDSLLYLTVKYMYNSTIIVLVSYL